MTPNQARNIGINVALDGKKRNLLELLSFDAVDCRLLSGAWLRLGDFSLEVQEQLEIEGKYLGYLERQEKDIKAFKRDEALLIPSGIDYWGIPGLSSEMRELLSKSQPRTLGSAGRVRGVTPGGLIALLAYVRGQSILTS